MRLHERLHVRLLVPIVVVLAVSLSLTLGWFLKREKAVLTAQALEEASLVSEVVKAGLRVQMQSSSKELTQQTLHLTSERAGLGSVALIGKDGKVIHSSRPDEIGTRLDRSDQRCAICHEGVLRPDKQVALTTDAQQRQVLRSINPIENEAACGGCHEHDGAMLGMLVIDQDVEPDMIRIGAMQRSLAGSAGLSIFTICLLVGLIVHRQVKRPVAQLMRGVEQLSAGRLTTPVQVAAKGELHQLAAGFNRMAGDLERQLQEIREQTFELSTLYTMVERVTRTIDLEQLRSIILDLVLETFTDAGYAALGYGLVEGADTTICARCKEGTEPIELTPDQQRQSGGPLDLDPALVERSHGATDERSFLSSDARGICLCLRAENRELGFLYVRKHAACSFSAQEHKLLLALSSHIAIALDNARLYQLAITDELTRLFTLRYFQYSMEEQIQRHRRYGEKVSLLMLDLDDFKLVNDEHGHLVGDALLREAGRTMEGSVRAIDVVCRYGGEEFAIILPETDKNGAQRVAARVCGNIAAMRCVEDGKEVSVTVSIGISSCPGGGTNVRELVEVADSALYLAKARGKNQVAMVESGEKPASAAR